MNKNGKCRFCRSEMVINNLAKESIFYDFKKRFNLKNKRNRSHSLTWACPKCFPGQPITYEIKTILVSFYDNNGKLRKVTIKNGTV